MTKEYQTRPPHVTTAQEARNEYNDIAADLSTWLDDGDGVTLTDAQKDWIVRYSESLDEAVSHWVTLLGGKP